MRDTFFNVGQGMRVGFVGTSLTWAIATMIFGLINTYCLEMKGGDAIRVGVEFVHALWTVLAIVLSHLLQKLHDAAEATSFRQIGLKAEKQEFHFIDNLCVTGCTAFFLSGLVLLAWGAFVWPIGGGDWFGIDTRMMRNLFLIVWGIIPLVQWFHITELWNGQKYVAKRKERHADQMRRKPPMLTTPE